MVKLRGFLVLVLIGFGASSVAPVSAQTVTAYVDRNPIPLEDTVQFVVRVNGGNPGGKPDLSSLENDFEVLGTAQSTQTSIINGRANTVTQWVSTLAPKRAGEIRIPSIRVGPDLSAPLTLTVLPSGVGSGADKARDLFIDLKVEPQDPYIQSQATYTVKLYHAVPIHEGRLDEPNSTDVLVQKLGEDRTYETVLDGRRYQVIERQYALFPQKSGPISIPPLTFTGQVPEQRNRRSLLDDMMGRRPGIFGNDPFDALFQTTRAVRTRSETVTLNVRPMPLSFKGGHWLPAEEVMLQETWTPKDLDQQALRVGEPITRTITMVAKGITGPQLPDFPVAQSDKTKIYPDQAMTDTKVEGTSTMGIRQQKLAFVPTESGEIHLPAIHIPWWDLTTNQSRVASLPARVLRILPESGKADPNSPSARPSSASDDNRPAAEDPVESINTIPSSVTVANPNEDPQWQLWKMGTAVLALLWMVTCVGWWYDRRTGRTQTDSKSSEAELIRAGNLKQARAACEKACRANKPREAKELLLQWAAKKWPVNSPIGLAGLAQRFIDPQVQAAIWELDRLLYAPNQTPWDGPRFWQTISAGMDEQESRRTDPGEVLPPLYLTGT